MFTGIVEDVGIVEQVVLKDSSLKLKIKNKDLFKEPALGGSISVNGVCLTQSDWKEGQSAFDVVQETLSKTNLGHLKKGDLVNLERSMKMDARIEGHLVQGHVDGVGHVDQFDAKLCELWIEIPDSMQQYLIEKGSITLDGVSLTIAAIENSRIKIALVPHTLAITNLRTKQRNAPINLEIDLFAKYTFKYLEKLTPQTSGLL